MTRTDAFVSFSTALSDLAARSGAAVLQVHGGRRAISGIVHGQDTVVTSVRGIGREDGLQVTLPDGTPVDADLTGWDPSTSIAVLQARRSLGLSAPSIADTEPRVGEVVLALARSWSNALTASAGTVAVVGGPLRTGRRREISRVIRITAPMHDGFAGGGVFDAVGRLTGIATAASIRGFGVVIPASIAWTAVEHVLTSGRPQRGFIGVAVRPVTLPDAQRGAGGNRGLLVMSITPSSPAEGGGLLVGDILLRLDDHPLEEPEDLLDMLTDRRIGQTAVLRVLRGNSTQETRIIVAKRE